MTFLIISAHMFEVLSRTLSESGLFVVTFYYVVQGCINFCVGFHL